MGSISRRERNGRVFYVGRVSRDGRQKSKTFDRRKDAKAWVDEMEGMKVNPSNVPVLRGIEAWREEANTEGTRAGRQHLAANLGDLAYIRVADVTATHIAEWRETLRKGRPWSGGAPLSESTVGTLTSVLSAFFNREQARGHIARNPVKLVNRRRRAVNQPVRRHEIWSTEQVNKLISVADDPIKTMMIVSATSGMRPGELAGLRLRSIDFERNAIEVVEQADGLYSTHDWKPLKTVSSERVVPVPKSTIKAIETYLEKSGHDRNPLLALFRTEGGGMWSSSHISREFAQIRKRANVAGPWRTFRHYYASMLIDSGLSVKVVQSRLGHSSAAITLNVYSHLFPESDSATRAVFEGVIG